MEGQLREQRHAALNHKSMVVSIKGEKDRVDKLIAQSQVCLSVCLSVFVCVCVAYHVTMIQQ